MKIGLILNRKVEWSENDCRIVYVIDKLKWMSWHQSSSGEHFKSVVYRKVWYYVNWYWIGEFSCRRKLFKLEKKRTMLRNHRQVWFELISIDYYRKIEVKTMEFTAVWSLILMN
jgi:hypothetical protein